MAPQPLLYCVVNLQSPVVPCVGARHTRTTGYCRNVITSEACWVPVKVQQLFNKHKNKGAPDTLTRKYVCVVCVALQLSMCVHMHMREQAGA